MMVAVVMVSVPTDSQHAPDAADDTTGHTADHGTSSRSNRTGYAPTLGCASLATAHDTLGLCDERHPKGGENAGGYNQSGLHERLPLCGASVDQAYGACDGLSKTAQISDENSL